MAGRAMNRIFQTVAAAMLLTLAACGATPAQEPPLFGARIGGPFTLTDQNGAAKSDTDFAGKWRIVYFGYTFCPDICPNDMLKLGQAMKLLDKSDPRVAAKIAPIFVSVDPERDTPAVVKQFVEQFHPRFTGLTGSLDAITKMAKDYAVAFRKEPSGDGYLVGHTQIAYLMDAEGKPITSLPLEKDAAAIADAVKHWVR
ncbi:MAG: SCO family protein [Sphingomonadales bacterium]|nr:MAG: SCO family protein [Sphingomonadales bacterium]